jgi:hypothetical protein
MNRYQIAGILWLVAAVLGAAVTLAYRTDTSMTSMMGPATWSAITFIGSAIAAVIGLLLLWRPSGTVVLLSTTGGVAWVLMYGALAVIQFDDLAAWPTDVVLGLFGAIAAVVAYRAQPVAARP